MVKIEAGKFYRTRDDRKIGPAINSASIPGARFDLGGFGYFPDGRRMAYSDMTGHLDHIVAEWTEGPVRTVAKKEIVPGLYGEVAVVGSIGTSRANVCVNGNLSAAQLRAAAATFLELADALDNA